MRLPNNAYDALVNHTQKLLDEGTSPSAVFQIQLNLLNNIPIFHEEVERLKAQGRPEVSEYLRSRLLRLPAVGLRIPDQTNAATQPPTSSSSSSQSQQGPNPPVVTSTPARRTETASPAVPQNVAFSPVPGQSEAEKQQQAQRAEHIKMQRAREQKARDERERIKAQIKADREERRRLDEMRKRGGNLEHEYGTPATSGTSGSTASKARNTEIRVQVRTFDGSTLRSTFQPSSTLSTDVRPWIDSTANTNVPYDLKIILTPLPNRNIEAGEEDLPLSDLGIVGSCTLVMVPVKGYVESYGGSTAGGLLGAAVSGGYNLVSGTAGMVLGGVKSLLGYNNSNTSGPAHTSTAEAQSESRRDTKTPAAAAAVARNARIRTLGDQRAESAGRDQQFYNGNQLNFEPKKDDPDKED